jgi:peptidoglycan/LPS O-acetylase OafA/YrhL
MSQTLMTLLLLLGGVGTLAGVWFERARLARLSKRRRTIQAASIMLAVTGVAIVLVSGVVTEGWSTWLAIPATIGTVAGWAAAVLLLVMKAPAEGQSLSRQPIPILAVGVLLLVLSSAVFIVGSVQPAPAVQTAGIVLSLVLASSSLIIMRRVWSAG